MSAPSADLNEILCATMVDMLAEAEKMEANANSCALLDLTEGFVE